MLYEEAKQLYRVVTQSSGLQRRITHAKARAEVLGKQLDGGAVRPGIILRQVAHGFYQQALSLDVARVGMTLLARPGGWTHRKGEDPGFRGWWRRFLH